MCMCIFVTYCGPFQVPTLILSGSLVLMGTKILVLMYQKLVSNSLDSLGAMICIVEQVRGEDWAGFG